MKKKSGNTFNKAQKLTIRFLVALAIGLILSFNFWVADALTTSRFPDSNTPALLYCTETKDDLCLNYCNAITSAKSSVCLIIYSLTDTKVIKALKQKSDEGIVVKVVCDAKASPGIDKKLGDKVTLTKKFGKGLMHQKILVIDKKHTWIGSANMTGESLRHHGNLVTAIESEKIADLAEKKAKSLADDNKPIFHDQAKVGKQEVELWFLPDDQMALRRLKQLIQSAKKTIRVAMFTWTRQDLAHSILDAKNRGVKVEVVIDNSAGRGAGAKVVEQLQKGGLPVKLSQGIALLHHKFMYIDEKILVNGSANWTKAAFNKNDDCFIVLNDMTEDQTAFMNKAWNIIYSDAR